MSTDYRGVPLAQVADIRSLSVRDYAKAREWKRIKNKRENIAVYQNPTLGRYDQLIVPIDKDLDDFEERIIDAVLQLASFEGRSPFAIIQDLLAPNADTLRFAIEGRTANAGYLSLSGGIDLLEGAKRALLSSACSVLSPVPHHPKLSRTEADQLLDSSRLNHTERGSFVVSISCPLSAVDTSPATLEIFDSDLSFDFTRRTTSLLMRSTERLVQAIRFDTVHQIFENNLDEPVISANLCDAILRIMEPISEDDNFRLSASWAPVLPIQSHNPPPTTVRVEREYFKSIEDIRDRLMPRITPKVDRYFGTVETLNGSMGSDNRRSGDVTLVLFYENEPIKVRADLTCEQYRLADQAHMGGKVIIIKGTLQEGKRVHRITEIKDFSLADLKE